VSRGRGDDDQVDGRVGEQVARILIRHRLGEIAADLVAAAAADRRKVKAVGGGDQGRMKEGACRAIADEAGGDRLHGRSLVG